MLPRVVDRRRRFSARGGRLGWRGEDTHSAIDYTLRNRNRPAQFEVLSPQYYKENGIVLWTCVRHALLTQDREWLESVWPKLERAAGYIQDLRRQSLQNDTPLDDGLNPPGEIDGGLSGHGTGFQRPEFSNVHWNLLGLRALIQGAHWLEKEDAAARWQSEYDDLEATFRRAAARDVCHDSHGRAYVPIFMSNAGQELPQRAQWTFCHAVYPGQIFAQNDPLVASTLQMLEATEREGMVYGTGWDATGIWNYFASFYGHAWLWQGNGPKAAQTLYAFANHACPTLVWREEQSLVGESFRKVGDMPHNWASAEFIRLVVHLLALDRGDELHLLEGFPRVGGTWDDHASERRGDTVWPAGSDRAGGCDRQAGHADRQTTRRKLYRRSRPSARWLNTASGTFAGRQRQLLRRMNQLRYWGIFSHSPSLIAD